MLFFGVQYMKAAFVCQDVYEYNIQRPNSPFKSGTGRQTKYMTPDRPFFKKGGKNRQEQTSADKGPASGNFLILNN